MPQDHLGQTKVKLCFLTITTYYWKNIFDNIYCCDWICTVYFYCGIENHYIVLRSIVKLYRENHWKFYIIVTVRFITFLLLTLRRH